jgi:hypothetical protein
VGGGREEEQRPEVGGESGTRAHKRRGAGEGSAGGRAEVGLVTLPAASLWAPWAPQCRIQTGSNWWGAPQCRIQTGSNMAGKEAAARMAGMEAAAGADPARLASEDGITIGRWGWTQSNGRDRGGGTVVPGLHYRLKD